MRRLFELVVSATPCALLVFSFISFFIDPTLSQYIVIDNSVGYSLLTGIVFIKLYIIDRNNLFNKLAVISLILMNIICIIGQLVTYDIMEVMYFSTIAIIIILLPKLYICLSRTH